MSELRFLLLEADTPRDPGFVEWRLLGRNNRELGRGARSYVTVDDCRRGIQALRSRRDELVQLVGADGPDRPRSWVVLLDGTAVAMSGRTYERQRECAYALQRFMVALAQACTATVIRSACADRAGSPSFRMKVS